MGFNESNEEHRSLLHRDVDGLEVVESLGLDLAVDGVDEGLRM